MTNKSLDFSRRHIGLGSDDVSKILDDLGFDSLDTFFTNLVPESIYDLKNLSLPAALDEASALKSLKEISKKNKVFKSYIGNGFYNCNVPAVIKRNVFENPGWYTSYTPYQPEIAQGRLEALMNYQTMIADLTAMDISNASLLDEPTAAAEAMSLLFAVRSREQKKNNSFKFLVSDDIFPQTLSLLKTRSKPLGIELVIEKIENAKIDNNFF